MTSTSMRPLIGAAALAAALMTTPASAVSVLFTGSGTWDADAPASALSAPGTSWSFSFEMPEFVAPNPSTAVSGFSYALGGSALAAAPLSVEFYSPADSGGFDIDFGAGMPMLSIYGDAVLIGGSLQPGLYNIFTSIDGGLPLGVGTVQLQPIPEPAAPLLLALGLGGVLLAARRRGAAAGR